MASDEQRATLLHSALVKASECEKCSWQDNGFKSFLKCLCPHYNTCRLSKGDNLNDCTLVKPFGHMFSDDDTEAVDCQSRGRGSPHDAPPSPSGVRGVSKDIIQGVKESNTAERGREWSKEAETSEKSPVVEHCDGLFVDPMAELSIAKALDGETGTGWTIIEKGLKRNLPEEESQGPEKESKKRPRSNTCELDCGRSPTIAPCRLCERRCCRECLEGDFKCDGGTGEFQCKECDPWQTSSLVQPRIWFIPATQAWDPAQLSLDHPGNYFIPVPPALLEPLSRSSC